MARTIHAADDATGPVALLLSYDESPDHPGLTRRYTSPMACALISAYLLKGRRHAFRVLGDAEAAAYRAERAAANAGAGI
jgi:hypothetical protein